MQANPRIPIFNLNFHFIISMSYFSPETINRISRLQVRARYTVEGFLSGQHKSPFFGSSVEFRQHREYVAGDDLRNLDWKVLAKQDKFYIKQYEAQTNLNATLLVDSSASMLYKGGKAAMSKYDYACTAAVCVGYLLLRQQDAVGCVRFDDSIQSVIPQKTKQNQLDIIVKALESSKPGNKTDMKPILQQTAQTYPHRGVFVLFSDLLTDRHGLFEGLKLLRAGGSDVLIFHILDDEELDFEFSGPTRFTGLENPQVLFCNPRALRDGYLEAINDYLSEISKGCSANKIQYHLTRTSTPLDAVLSSVLK